MESRCRLVDAVTTGVSLRRVFQRLQSRKIGEPAGGADRFMCDIMGLVAPLARCFASMRRPQVSDAAENPLWGAIVSLSHLALPVISAVHYVLICPVWAQFLSFTF